jgi:hypothetical protein
MTGSETISDLKRLIVNARRQRDNLTERYGLGVRPSHVSTDLAILDSRLERYKAQKKALELSNGKLG